MPSTPIAPEPCWREGKLFEISPFGTGFIEEATTGLAYGFHLSMIRTEQERKSDLEEQQVRFFLSGDGKVGEVELSPHRV